MSSRSSARYQTDGPRSGSISVKVIVVVAIIFAVLFVGVFARYLIQRYEQPVDASMAGFERIDDSTLELSLDISRRDITRPSYCIVLALNYSMAEVGRREVLVPPGGEETQRITVSVPTRDVPVSGNVYGCSATIPHHMAL